MFVSRVFLRAVVPVSVAVGSSVVGAACESSGNVGVSDAGTNLGILPDGNVAVIDGQSKEPGFACAFLQRSTFVCPDVTLAPTAWEAQCVDGDDCKSRVNGSSSVAGCTQTTEYQAVNFLTSTCAGWKASGGTEPTIDSGAPAACAPGVLPFTPKWHAPRAKSTACTKVQIDAYRQCLDDSASALNPPSCASFTTSVSAADQSCLTCLQSNESDATYGPLIHLPTETLLNVAGCIALAEGKTDGSGCGGALSAEEQCDRTQCLPVCPTATASELATEQACEKAADTGACATYEKPAECAGAIEESDAGAAGQNCFGLPSGSGDAVFEAVAMAFCGGG